MIQHSCSARVQGPRLPDFLMHLLDIARVLNKNCYCLLCEAGPILDLHAWPHTVHMCSRVDGGREVLAFCQARLSCSSATLISSNMWTAL